AAGPAHHGSGSPRTGPDHAAPRGSVRLAWQGGISRRSSQPRHSRTSVARPSARRRGRSILFGACAWKTGACGVRWRTSARRTGPRLRKELEAFKVKVTVATGNETFEV